MIHTYVSIRRADGSMSVMAFLNEGEGSVLPHGATWKDQSAGIWLREATQGNLLAEISRAVPNAVGFRIIAFAEIPTDRTFRAAWMDDGLKLQHDMAKAKELRREQLRAERAPLFAQLDAEYMRADEAGDQAEKKRIAKEKQRLRDVTADPRIDAATSIEQLKSVLA